jgi:hypothetical protein
MYTDEGEREEQRQIGLLREHLKGITYKPGWAFEVCYRPNAGYPDFPETYLNIEAQVTDVYHTERTTTVNLRKNFNTNMFFDMLSSFELEFTNFVHRAIVELEMHEIDEWFKVHGRHVRDPHPELKRVLQRPPRSVWE